jgi:fibronectin type 3 domain-containing protein
MSIPPTKTARLKLEQLEAREVPAGQLLGATLALQAGATAVLTKATVSAKADAQVTVSDNGHVHAALSVRANAALTAPVAPASFTATAISTSQVRLSWADTPNENGYRVYQWNGVNWVNVGNLGANVTSAVVSNLAAGKKYYFYVESYNALGSTPSAVQGVVTLTATPTMPGAFTATALSGTQVRLSWADSGREDGYRVYQWNGSSWGVITSLGANSTSYTVSGLTGGRTYYFYVEAFNGAGSVKTAFQSVTTSAPPPVPASFAATALSGTQVRLSWADTTGEDGYRVYQWNGANWVNVGNLGAGTTSAVISNLTAGRTYYFYVEAFNVNGSSKTAFQTVQTGAPLAPPSSFTAGVLPGGTVRLSWADTAGEDGYRVYLWNGSAYTVIANLNAGMTWFDVAGLARQRTYYFYVEAFRGTEKAATQVATVMFG